MTWKHWRCHGFDWWTNDLMGHEGGNECPACGQPAELIGEFSEAVERKLQVLLRYARPVDLQAAERDPDWPKP